MLQRMRVIATAPELYAHVVDTKTIPLLVTLLAHANEDIAAVVVELIQVRRESRRGARYVRRWTDARAMRRSRRT